MILRTLVVLLWSSALLTAAPQADSTFSDSTLVERPPAERAASIIGQHTRLVMSSKDLLQSMAWWTRMGFTPRKLAGERADSAITLSDGQVTITLVSASQPSPIIAYRCANLSRLKEQLDSLLIGVNVDLQGPTYRELRFRSPGGVHVAARLAAIEPDIAPTKEPNPLCGELKEYSTSVASVTQEKQWWADLGFAPTKQATKPYPFVNMADKACEIGIHQDRDIANMALTYFMPDMEVRIERLKNAGMKPIEEIPTSDKRIANAIFQSPDGQLVFLFETPK
jgi:hypothetical protein